MAELKVDKRTLKKIPVGDMRGRISLRQRDVAVPDFDNPAKFEEAYKTIAIVWCKVKTNPIGRDEFTDVNISTGGGVFSSSTHVFTMRYREGITTQNVVSYKDENYKINRIVNLEERDMYLELHCKVLGDETLEANQ